MCEYPDCVLDLRVIKQSVISPARGTQSSVLYKSQRCAVVTEPSLSSSPAPSTRLPHDMDVDERKSTVPPPTQSADEKASVSQTGQHFLAV